MKLLHTAAITLLLISLASVSYGQVETARSANGAVYIGEFRDGLAHGQGTLTLANGDVYVGEFRDNQRNGQGTMTYANGNLYVGEFRDNQYNGQGTVTFANGNVYVGEFRDGLPSGQGRATLANGQVINGIFNNGQLVTANNIDVATNNAVLNSSSNTPNAAQNQAATQRPTRSGEPITGFDGFTWGSSRNDIMAVRGIPWDIDDYDGSATYRDDISDTVGGFKLSGVSYLFREGCSGLRETISSPCYLIQGRYVFENNSETTFNQISEALKSQYGEYEERKNTVEEMSNYSTRTVGSINEYTNRTFVREDGSSVEARWATRGTTYVHDILGRQEAGPIVLVVEYTSAEKNRIEERSNTTNRSF